MGTVIKNRFVLESVLGRGGMGVVYKAKDLRKEEAQDRNPYVAVKILNEDFKRHPDSLKALQRESRKAQSLAHPNVVTVFDFDRDGGTVFMTMEYLEGESLDKFNKRHSGRGVPVPRALELIEGLSNGLAYAHHKGVVHSDFKPGNAFLTSEGLVKIFDFGIARAAKQTGAVAGEKTLFDAATLGALTPAYASCEMLEGKDPDPRDDVYALACVSYELFSGRHPFDKLPAVSARDRGLVPERIKSLGMRQWQGLMEGLAFDRERRSPGVRQFLASLKPKPMQKAVIAGVVTTVLLALALGVLWFPGYLERQRLNDIVSAIQSGNRVLIEEVNPELLELSADARASVFLDSDTRSRYVQFVRQRIETVFYPAQQRYDYPAAAQLLDELKQLMPDSVAVAELQEAVASTLDASRLQQQDKVRELLDGGALIALQGSPNVVEVLQTLKQMDPDDATDQDALIPLRFAAEAAAAFEAGDLDVAEALVEEGRRFAPEDAVFASLGDRITIERNARLKADLESRIQAALPQLNTFEDFEALRPDLVGLLALEPDSAVLASALSRLRTATDATLESDIARYRYGSARQALERVNGILPEDFVQSGLARVNTAEASGVSALVAKIEQSVAESPDDMAALDRIFADLEDADADPIVILRVRDAAAGAFIAQARGSISSDDPDTAKALLARGAETRPSASIGDEIDLLTRQLERQAALAAAENEQQRQELQEQGRLELLGLKQQFEQGLSQPALTVAQGRTLLGLLDQLEAQQIAVATDSRAQIAQLMVRGTRQLAEQDRWSEALSAARDAAALMPAIPLLGDNVSQLEADNYRRLNRQRVSAGVAALDNLLTSPQFDLEWSEQVNREIARLGSLLPADDPTLAGATQQAALVYLQRAQDMRRAERFEVAEQALARANALMPGFAGLALEEDRLAQARTEYRERTQTRARLARIDSLKERLRQEARAGQLDRARRTLDQVAEQLPADNEFVVAEGPGLIAAAYLDSAGAASRRRQFDQALALVERGLEFAPDNGPLLDARVRFAEELAAAGQQRSPGSRTQPAPAPMAQQDLAKIANERIRRSLATGAISDEAALRSDLSRLRELDPSLYDETAAWASAQLVGQTEMLLADGRTEEARSRKNLGMRLFQSDAALAAIAIPATVSAGPDPCAGADLVGRGAARDGSCRDAIPAGGNGPYMVVIPGAVAGARPFAISKYEITVREYNAYCSASGSCPGFEAPDDLVPVTHISITDARDYAGWLSQQTGRSYRLPSAIEWEHAARAETGAIRWNFNCQVREGGKLVSGVSLQPVAAGTDNNWGLRNYIGNAREWVDAGGALEARGGAYTDAKENCSVTARVAHSGEPDNITGMRLVRAVE